MLPIILLVLEYHLKFIQTFNENRSKMVAEMKKERRTVQGKLRDERREKRWACIESTQGMWSELMSLTSDVVYYENGTTPPDRNVEDGNTIEEIMKALIGVMVKYKSIVTAWFVRMPELEYYYPAVTDCYVRVIDLFHSFIVMQFNSTYAVAESIRTGNDAEEIEELQYALEIIQERIDDVLHFPMLLILKDAAKLEDVGGTEDERNRLYNQMDWESFGLNHWANVYFKIDNHNPILPTLGDQVPHASSFRSVSGQFEEQYRQSPVSDPDDYPEYREMQQHFFQIAPEAIIHDSRIRFTSDYIKELAREMAFDQIHRRVENNAFWCPPKTTAQPRGEVNEG
jgi:hypothetical protein